MGGKRARKSSPVVTDFTFLIPKRTVFLSEVITPKTGKGHFYMAMGIFNSQLYLLKKVYSAERTMKTNASHTIKEVKVNKGSSKQGNYSLRRPPKLVIPQAVIGKDGLLYIQTCTSKQSYTARVRVDCAV